jgi:hypothetical protein
MGNPFYCVHLFRFSTKFAYCIVAYHEVNSKDFRKMAKNGCPIMQTAILLSSFFKLCDFLMLWQAGIEDSFRLIE